MNEKKTFRGFVAVNRNWWLGVPVGILLTVGYTGFASAEEIESRIARGGMLYDNWYEVLEQGKPETSHPAYPSDKKYADEPASNWRCKECHGWDYHGADGAYASGKHATGIVGIQGMKGANPGNIISILKDKSHGYTGKMSEEDFQDLALFVSKGQIDMDKYIDRPSKMPKGNKARGEAYYNTICAKCHGKDGLSPKGMKPFGAQMGNPWEVMHKILNGQPDSEMPALRALPYEVTTDIMTYMTKLPAKRH
jgi:thiosulfate dehydrogenase